MSDSSEREKSNKKVRKKKEIERKKLTVFDKKQQNNT